MFGVSKVLSRVMTRLCAVALLAFAGLAAVPGEARALNVPGSASGDFVMDTVFYAVEDAASLAQGGGGVNFAGGGYELASISAEAGSQFDGFITGGDGTDWGISATFDYRHLDLDAGGLDLDYNVFVGSLALGYAVDDQITLVGGALMEYGFGESDFNNGTIDGVGFGLFTGAIFAIDSNWTISGFGGVQALSFDVTRAANTITGNYDAIRYFVAGEIDYSAVSGPLVWRAGGGARYLYQDSDSYQETGGIFVPSITEEVFTLTSRVKLGYMVGDGITPFTELNFRYDVSNDTSTAAGIATLSQSLSDWSLSPRIGVEWARTENVRLMAQTGLIVSGDGFDGVDLRLNAQIRF